MIITNVEFVPNKTITAHLGLVTGGTVRAKNAVKDFGASVKNMFGGEIQNYIDKGKHPQYYINTKGTEKIPFPFMTTLKGSGTHSKKVY